MHSGWNAVVKGSGDPFASVTHVTLFYGAIAALLLPFVDVPAPPVWVWLAASAALHTLYRFMLAGAYRTGDMAQVYPIMRGGAPMMTAVGAALLLGEVISGRGFLAVAVLSAGVFLMSLKGGRVGSPGGRAIAFAFGSAACTCGYTLVDGWGARLNGSGPGFALWMFVVNASVMQAIALAWRGREVYADLRAEWGKALGGGVMSMGSYFIAIWAMTKAPIALVAALRETSVLFGALIAFVMLKEPLTGWRFLASALVLSGVALLRLA
jgi:drug/metabolite transporter (DMT)-like permease